MIMNVGSLFSGIGGIEKGMETVGFNTVWFIEREPYCQAILRKQYPSATIYDDVTKIDFRTIPKVDILTGGFPCQDISNAGKRVGIQGSRSSLWKYYCKAISEIRPKYAIIENVAALIRRGLNVVLSNLAEIGYDAEWYCISASSVGALHRRERVFIIAYPNSSRHIYGQIEEQPTEGREYALSQSKSICADVSNTQSNGCNRGRSEENISVGDREFLHCEEEVGSQVRSKTEGCLCNNEQGYWSSEPELGRVANGISNRLDRIKCLGNAVVPQCAEVIAKAIKEVA